MVMLRQGLLWLSERRGIHNFVRRNGVGRRFAARFVAGETVEEAVEAAAGLARRGITATLDFLGESVTAEAEAAAARDQYLRMLDQLAARGVEVNVSVKPTGMGLDIGEEVCARNFAAILDRATALGGFVRLDMESSAYTQWTLDLFRRLYQTYDGRCGVVIQSALRRSEADVAELVAMGARVRLTKGAYLEPPEVAYQDKADVDRAYVRLMETLLDSGRYPAIATHDEAILARAREFARVRGIGPDRFEFQMLYGVRRDLQERLRAAGYRVRVYIPFGSQWYPYLMRRLAERPANLAFILGSVARESVAGHRRRPL